MFIIDGYVVELTFKLDLGQRFWDFLPHASLSSLWDISPFFLRELQIFSTLGTLLFMRVKPYFHQQFLMGIVKYHFRKR